jgi:hypothetical protein
MGCRRAVTTPSLRFFRNDSIVIAHGQELSIIPANFSMPFLDVSQTGHILTGPQPKKT